jgi:hypothetical protein
MALGGGSATPKEKMRVAKGQTSYFYFYFLFFSLTLGGGRTTPFRVVRLPPRAKFPNFNFFFLSLWPLGWPNHPLWWFGHPQSTKPLNFILFFSLWPLGMVDGSTTPSFVFFFSFFKAVKK